MVQEIWERTPNGCGHRQVRMCLVHEFGHAHIRQERARGHAAHGTEMRHPLQEPMEALQLVQGRDGRSRA